MTLPFFIFTYAVVWCVTLFTVLPVQAWKGAKKKLLWNSAIALGITLGIHFLLLSGLVPLREAA